MQVVDKPEDAAFTISVDVNSVSKGNEVIGYSMIPLIYGTYDRAVLNAIFDALRKDSKEKSTRTLPAFLKYTASGNIFLAATIHTHGPLSGIDEAYDQIVGKLKTYALAELRRFKEMVDDVSSDTTSKPLPKIGFKQ